MPDEPEKAKQGFVQGVGLQRYATPQEIAQMMLFLAGDESSYCTGSIYMIDGGMTKRN
jgi:NAD(P)-dependent dehydrogenase (short-subunit alcohol dehydrogenase family)